MFYVKTNDDFFLKKIISLFNQNNFILTSNYNENFFFKLEFLIFEKNLQIISNNKKLIFNLPISFNKIFIKTLALLSEINIKFYNAEYNPVKNIFFFNQKSVTLGEIHNIIISNFVLYLEQGVDKNYLYNRIWPNDKDIQINKLDTHLTNLKNLLFDKTGFSLKFTSSKSFVKINP